MTPEELRNSLTRCRSQVDAIDLELLNLLNRRTRVIEEIGSIKEALDLPIYEPKREEDVFRHVTGNNTGPLTPDALQRIFERIIDEMRSLQRMRRAQQTEGKTECS